MLCQEDFKCIWEVDHQHFYAKWENDNNLLSFLNKLDEYNRGKFLEYFYIAFS